MSGDAAASPKKEQHFLVPSPHTTRRTRTKSQCERAASGPTFQGTIKEFCRNKGHGFIIPKEGGDPLFCHISDIDGDYVPKEGDLVSYKTHLVPPKNEKVQAVHVEILQPAPGVKHETWEADGLRT